MEALSLHEAVPGTICRFRWRKRWRTRRISESTPGTPHLWRVGAVSEGLGEDVGMLHRSVLEVRAVSYEMWRAVRLVVDTGMHSMNWTREQAIPIFQGQHRQDRSDITVEVDRYIVCRAKRCL